MLHCFCTSRLRSWQATQANATMSGLWDSTSGPLQMDGSTPFIGYRLSGFEIAKGSKPGNWVKGIAYAAKDGSTAGSAVWKFTGHSYSSSQLNGAAVEFTYTRSANAFSGKCYYNDILTEWRVRFSVSAFLGLCLVQLADLASTGVSSGRPCD